MFRLNDKITIKLKNKKVTGQLIGIDSYRMENFLGGECAWLSYTLTSAKKGVFGRYWLACWGKTEWILWTKTIHKKIPAELRLALGKSGLAKIGFQGDAGQSTPIAALAQYKHEKDYFCIERFSNSKVMYFNGRKIQNVKLEK